MNYLDEIEAELGKERTLKVGDRVRTYYTRKEGVIVGPCPRHSGNWHVDVGDGTCDVKCVAECNLTPVEPERVKEDAFPQWHPPCGFQGLCHNGWGSKWCAECPWFDKAPSPGLLQRMGMATWDGEWFIRFRDYSDTQERFYTKAAAVSRILELEGRRKDCSTEYRAFKWNDGVR